MRKHHAKLRVSLRRRSFSLTQVLSCTRWGCVTHIVNLKDDLWPFEMRWNGGKPPISLHQSWRLFWGRGSIVNELWNWFLMKPPLCLTSKRAEPKEHVRAETGVDWRASKLRGWFYVLWFIFFNFLIFPFKRLSKGSHNGSFLSHFSCFFFKNSLFLRILESLETLILKHFHMVTEKYFQASSTLIYSSL